MGGTTRVLHVFCAGLLALLALSGKAAAQRRPQATFSVITEGTETVSATMRAEGETCPAGTATETDRFAAAPSRIRIEDTGPFLEMTGLSRHGEDGRQPFAVAGSVTRNENGSFTCRLETPADCGTKPFAGLSMWLQGSSLRRGRITLLVSLHAEDPPDVFSSCPPVKGFPALFVVKPPQVQVPAASLFDRRKHTLVLSASRLTNTEALDGNSRVEASLKLTLRRL